MEKLCASAIGGADLAILDADRVDQPDVGPARPDASQLVGEQGDALFHPLFGFEDDLFDDFSSFAFRGSVFGSDRINVTTDLCVGNIYVGGVCNPPGTPLVPPLMVFDGGPSTQLVDVRTFPLVNMLGVRNTITLQALGTSANMTALDNGVLITPEPSAFLMLSSGLLTLLVRRVRAKIH